MRQFRFRGTAVLALRQRQDDEAQRALGAAVAARVAGEQVVERATVAVDEATLRARDAQQAAHLPSLSEWHRNWTLSCQHMRAAAEATLEARRQAERQVRARAHAARRALRALERWHDRAQQKHSHDTWCEEQRDLDELGAVRFAARRRAGRDE